MKMILILAAVGLGGYLLYQKIKRPGGYTVAGFTFARSDFDYGARHADTAISAYGG